MKVSTIFNQFFKCNQCKLTLTSPRIRNNQRHSVSRKIMTEKIDWSRLDPFQIGLLQEQCILVDENDKIVGFDSKKHCHLMENIEKDQNKRSPFRIISPTRAVVIHYIMRWRSKKKMQSV
ncbi:hypothetical protein SSS_00781 [Sarcoptes scabiei]|nr:hypothetical protein SSS_00781 [Sarcoptes scabiei]